MNKRDTFQEALNILMKIEPWFSYIRKIGVWLEMKINVDLFSFIKWKTINIHL